jgi:hypothetical protein
MIRISGERETDSVSDEAIQWSDVFRISTIGVRRMEEVVSQSREVAKSARESRMLLLKEI